MEAINTKISTINTDLLLWNFKAYDRPHVNTSTASHTVTEPVQYYGENKF
jgi:hypothetical protein